MLATPSLIIDLTGVARLAGVQRPVASMWRSRFASTSDPFPAAIGEKNGKPQFDAQQIAEWLARTEHGNNPQARQDAAAASVPADFSFADESAVAELEALICLIAQTDSLEDRTLALMNEAAATADPLDEMLRCEIAAHVERGAPWLDYARRLVDAAYSPSAALALVGRRHAASSRAAGSAGPLVADAIALVVDTTLAVVGNTSAAVTLDAYDAEFSSALAASLGDEATLVVPDGLDTRRVRRRLLADGHWLSEGDERAPRSIVVMRVPSDGGGDVAAMLRAVEDVALGMRDADAAVVIGPARALTDQLRPAEEQLRADILRSGRVRGIARLTTGLVDSAPRESLALWVLGPPMGQVEIADRFTVVADLTDVELTHATRIDLVSDIITSMGSARAVRGHAFRFAGFARTATLLARGGSLVGSAPSKLSRRAKPAELPALIDAAADAVGADMAPIPLAPAAEPPPSPASVTDLIARGHLRIIAGTRLSPDLLGSEGLVVATASDLDDPTAIGRTRVDQLAFAMRHPSASLTRPGDVIFRTAPTAAAWVDGDGSKVVAYPARVLRITAGDHGGLVPEVIAADIAGAASGPGAWKRWMLRRVAPHAIAPLRRALADIAAVRSDLEARAAHLDRYAALIVAGATSGAVSIINPTTAADAASIQ